MHAWERQLFFTSHGAGKKMLLVGLVDNNAVLGYYISQIEEFQDFLSRMIRRVQKKIIKPVYFDL